MIDKLKNLFQKEIPGGNKKSKINGLFGCILASSISLFSATCNNVKADDYESDTRHATQELQNLRERAINAEKTRQVFAKVIDGGLFEGGLIGLVEWATRALIDSETKFVEELNEIGLNKNKINQIVEKAKIWDTKLNYGDQITGNKEFLRNLNRDFGLLLITGVLGYPDFAITWLKLPFTERMVSLPSIDDIDSLLSGEKTPFTKAFYESFKELGQIRIRSFHTIKEGSLVHNINQANIYKDKLENLNQEIGRIFKEIEKNINTFEQIALQVSNDIKGELFGGIFFHELWINATTYYEFRSQISIFKESKDIKTKINALKKILEISKNKLKSDFEIDIDGVSTKFINKTEGTRIKIGEIGNSLDEENTFHSLPGTYEIIYAVKLKGKWILEKAYFDRSTRTLISEEIKEDESDEEDQKYNMFFNKLREGENGQIIEDQLPDSAKGRLSAIRQLHDLIQLLYNYYHNIEKFNKLLELNQASQNSIKRLVHKYKINGQQYNANLETKGILKTQQKVSKKGRMKGKKSIHTNESITQNVLNTPDIFSEFRISIASITNPILSGNLDINNKELNFELYGSQSCPVSNRILLGTTRAIFSTMQEVNKSKLDVQNHITKIEHTTGNESSVAKYGEEASGNIIQGTALPVTRQINTTPIIPTNGIGTINSNLASSTIKGDTNDILLYISKYPNEDAKSWTISNLPYNTKLKVMDRTQINSSLSEEQINNMSTEDLVHYVNLFPKDSILKKWIISNIPYEKRISMYRYVSSIERLKSKGAKNQTILADETIRLYGEYLGVLKPQSRFKG